MQIRAALRAALQRHVLPVRPRGGVVWIRSAIVTCGLLWPLLGQRLDAQTPRNDLADLDIEQLMNLTVTTAAKKEERIAEVASAIHVITEEDIRRSGASTIAEALRLVPGVDVARVNSTHWEVGIRGFTQRQTNKLLVLIDGRSVYSPTFSEVQWDVQDTLLADIDRIEVIRGPGGTLWGANAVNGVINIITKHSRDTQGSLLVAEAGTQENGLLSFRHGGRWGEHLTYRAYGKYFSRENLVRLSGRQEPGRWAIPRGGVRLDWEPSLRNALTWQGELYRGSSQRGNRSELVSFTAPFERVSDDSTDLSGGNLLTRWTRTPSNRSSLELQLYYDRASRADAQGDRSTRGEATDTFDLEFHNRVGLRAGHEVLWGMGFRVLHESIENTFDSSFDPADETTRIVNLFLQDEITLIPDRLSLVLGSKVEHNSYTDFEAAPNVRFEWSPRGPHTLWGAVSRAVRTPSRSEVRETSVGAVSVNRLGIVEAERRFPNPDLKSEALRAHELGYRVRPAARLSLDTALFYNDYDDLVTTEQGTRSLQVEPSPYLLIPSRVVNKLRGETYGAELAANYDVTPSWRLRGSHSWVRVELHRDASIPDPRAEREEGGTPRHQFKLFSYLRLRPGLRLDSFLYYSSERPRQRKPEYARLDARLAWQLTHALQASVTVQSLLPARHGEFGTSDPFQIERSAYTKWILSF